ncbi:EcsC family protein [Priestia sp. OVS21]|nr:EcsC family protein [Priestia sp. OVS21]
MMILTNREEQLLEEIYKWEESLQSVEATEMELLYEEWLEKGLNLIPASVRETYLHKIDEGLFQLTALIQGTEMQTQATKRIIETARVFKEDITELSEMNSFK